MGRIESSGDGEEEEKNEAHGGGGWRVKWILLKV
jgi:hypothetical protein